MKNLSFLFFFLFSILLNAQDKEITIQKNEQNLAEYTEIIEIPEMTKADLYIATLEWYNKTYNSGKSVIQSADKDGGMIIGNAISENVIYNNMGIKKDGGNFSYTISVYCKDNKFKYVIDNITYRKGDMALKAGANLAEDFPSNWTGWLGDNKQTRREWKSFQTQANIYFEILINDLKKHLKNSKSKSNW